MQNNNKKCSQRFKKVKKSLFLHFDKEKRWHNEKICLILPHKKQNDH